MNTTFSFATIYHAANFFLIVEKKTVSANSKTNVLRMKNQKS